MKVAAVVVSHGHPTELSKSLPLLREQVDELVVIANVPGSVPAGVEAVHNDRPLGFGANLNRGFASTTADLVLAANPDAEPQPGAVAALRSFMEQHPRCGIAGPRMEFPDGSWQPSRRRFPTVTGTIVRRTPLRLVVPQRHHFHLDEAPPAEPVAADWMLGGFLLLRRAMLDELGGFDERFRLYGEDIDLAYRAAQAGWERWYVPQAIVRHEHKAETDKRWLTRRTLWHWAGVLRFVRKHPERLRAL
ncbi:MAG TPA: glycosyltransferase family 2 protein [Dehalococcoidia bacterium]|nr:glycosyltransferase family 2 protein [Dehalococcoidia bacterium]